MYDNDYPDNNDDDDKDDHPNDDDDENEDEDDMDANHKVCCYLWIYDAHLKRDWSFNN